MKKKGEVKAEYNLLVAQISALTEVINKPINVEMKVGTRPLLMSVRNKLLKESDGLVTQAEERGIKLID